jgi:hypothetical protein
MEHHFALAVVLCLLVLPGSYGITCPEGQILTTSSFQRPTEICRSNPCYNNDPCLGGTCSPREVCSPGGCFIGVSCTCNAPAVESRIFYDKNGTPFYTICAIPGQDPCSTNPCKNGGTCALPAQPTTGEGPYYTCSCVGEYSGFRCGDPPPFREPGLCGTGAAADFPRRCYFNNDPLGRFRSGSTDTPLHSKWLRTPRLWGGRSTPTAHSTAHPTTRKSGRVWQWRGFRLPGAVLLQQ